MPENNDFTIDEAYLADERKRVIKLFSRSKHGLAGGFIDASALADWWINQLNRQDGRCAYCETQIRAIEKLIAADHLPFRAVRGEGRRGPRLELERLDAKGPYSSQNCALACYYCNNDKSYIYSAEDYKTFFAPAKRAHFESLLKKLSGK